MEGNVEYLLYHTNADYLFIADKKVALDKCVRVLVGVCGVILYLATLALAWLVLTPGLVYGSAVRPGRSPFQQVGGETSFGFTSQLTRSGPNYQRVSDAYARSSDSLEEDQQQEINWPDDDQQQLEFPKGS